MQNNPQTPGPQQKPSPNVQPGSVPGPQQYVPPFKFSPGSPQGALPTTPLGTQPVGTSKTVPPPPPGTPSGGITGAPLKSPPAGPPQSTSQTASLQNRKPLRTEYPPNLRRVDNGNVVTALKALRDNVKRTSPNEIYLVLDPSGVAQAAEAQFSQEAQIVEGQRNTLILLPIMVTWISLGLAGLAYAQSIAMDKTLVAKPLLQQWAEGFTNLKYVSVWLFHMPLAIGPWHYFSFGDVAFLDFLLFVILLVLTRRAQRIEVRAAKDAAELGIWLREECEILRAHTFARTIGQGAGGDTPEWAVLVNESVANLQAVMDEATKLIRSFDEVLRDDRETVSKALAAVDNLNAIYESGRRTYEKLEVTLPHLDTSIDKMTDSQLEAMRSLDKIASAVNASSHAVVQLTQPFATVGVAQLAKDTFNTLQQTQSQQKHIQDALTRQATMVDKMNLLAQNSSVYPWWNIRRYTNRVRSSK